MLAGTLAAVLTQRLLLFLAETTEGSCWQLLVFPSAMQSQRKEVKEEHCNTIHTHSCCAGAAARQAAMHGGNFRQRR
jgi:hypothetical protein